MFYIIHLRRCPCGKPATHGIQGSGNIDYERALCEKCAERRLRELERAYAADRKLNSTSEVSR